MNTFTTYRTTQPVSYVDRFDKLRANAIISSRFISKNLTLFQGAENEILNRFSAQAEREQFADSVPVQTLDPATTPIDVIASHVTARANPVYIPGFARGCPAVDSWSSDFFKDKFGHEVVPVIDGDHYDKMTLADVVDMIKSGSARKQKYLQAVADMFCNHRELFDYLPMGRLFQLQRSGFHGAELFMGAQGTGSPWHAANEWTFFVNVVGQKQWKFIRPQFTLHMKPYYQKDLIYVVSAYADSDPEGITTYDVTLNPGDVLVFPAWWWHRVKNLSDETIGVAVRFRTLMQQIKSPNPTLSMLQLTTAQQWKNIWLERTTGRLKDDERYLWRAHSVVGS